MSEITWRADNTGDSGTTGTATTCPCCGRLLLNGAACDCGEPRNSGDSQRSLDEILDKYAAAWKALA